MGIDVTIDPVRRGYYPRGGAAIRSVIFAGEKPNRLQLSDRGALKQVTLFSQASRVLRQRRVAERQIDGALAVLDSLNLPIRSDIAYDASLSAGSSICIAAEFENTVVGFDGLGAKGKRAEEVGRETAEGFVPQLQSSACLDRYMADQILPYLPLVGDRSSVTVSEVTSHCRTNMWVIDRFLEAHFEISGNGSSGWPERFSRA